MKSRAEKSRAGKSREEQGRAGKSREEQGVTATSLFFYFWQSELRGFKLQYISLEAKVTSIYVYSYIIFSLLLNL
ncbi:hypothetical protein [Paenibacillus urinalis]|uniref:hypothetical protein n=1 Tax=Paenibacillus urinalis TaxID=521520 RepID=UPI0019604A95